MVTLTLYSIPGMVWAVKTFPASATKAQRAWKNKQDLKYGAYLRCEASISAPIG